MTTPAPPFAVFDKAVDAHVVPQRMLSHSGALNPHGADTWASSWTRVDGRRGLGQVLVITDGCKVTVADLEASSSSSTPRLPPRITSSATVDRRRQVH